MTVGVGYFVCVLIYYEADICTGMITPEIWNSCLANFRLIVGNMMRQQLLLFEQNYMNIFPHVIFYEWKFVIVVFR